MANRFSIRKNLSFRYFDPTLLLTVVILLVFGLVMLYSASSYDGSVTFGDSAWYVKRQAVNTVIGLMVMAVIMFVPYHFWERTSAMAYAAAMLLILLIIPFGSEANGAKRWLRFLGISIQPAEVAKLAVIIALAHIIVRMGSAVSTWKGFIIVMLSVTPMAGAIYVITDNLSSAIIVFGIALTMCFVASPDYFKFIAIALGLSAIAALFVFVCVKYPESGLGFRGARIRAWLDPNAYVDNYGYQPLQALYAIGSGGIFGKGIGQSMQKLGYLPEAQNDMIFSIICEELGFFGALCVILLFLLLLWRCMITANNAQDLYGALLVTGFMAHIAIQVILNIAVVTSTIPNTGISLPFISYGGSSVVALLFEVGLVFAVQRGIRIRDF